VRSVRTTSTLWWRSLDLPDFPELPALALEADNDDGDQRYHLEVWCEKSTMNDVLEPLCASYGVNLQTGLGELSISATLDLAQRLQQVDKPARILYVSDFDPAGQSMPVAVSRKLEYFIRSGEQDLDVRVFPVVLTREQVERYALPRTPVKEAELRRGAFEDRYGGGAVELDALEALHPGELRRVITACIGAYYDAELAGRVRDARLRLERDLRAISAQVHERHAARVDGLRAQWQTIAAEFAARVHSLAQQIEDEWQAVRADLEEATPDIDTYPVPQARPGCELGEGLYNSARDYMDQLAAYKEFQGKVIADHQQVREQAEENAS
jgi:hypothetical protein